MRKREKLREKGNTFWIILSINFCPDSQLLMSFYTGWFYHAVTLHLISDLSLFSNSGTFQLRFEFHIQIEAEISSVVTHSGSAEGKTQMPQGERCGLGTSKQPLQDWWTGAVHTVAVKTGIHVSSDLCELSSVGWLRNKSCLISYPS